MLMNLTLHNGERDYDLGVFSASAPSTGWEIMGKH